MFIGQPIGVLTTSESKNATCLFTSSLLLEAIGSSNIVGNVDVESSLNTSLVPSRVIVKSLTLSTNSGLVVVSTLSRNASVVYTYASDLSLSEQISIGETLNLDGALLTQLDPTYTTFTYLRPRRAIDVKSTIGTTSKRRTNNF